MTTVLSVLQAADASRDTRTRVVVAESQSLFREALRQALVTEREIAASQGVYNFTEKDRYGLDDRSRILLTVKDGKYVLLK